LILVPAPGLSRAAREIGAKYFPRAIVREARFTFARMLSALRV
jgi:hypothetical protein